MCENVCVCTYLPTYIVLLLDSRFYYIAFFATDAARGTGCIVDQASILAAPLRSPGNWFDVWK